MSITSGTPISASAAASIGSPRRARSWAMKPRRGPAGTCCAEIGERVVHGDHLGERADGEPAAVLVEHLRRPLGGRPQREAVLGQRRRRPQLAAGVHRGAGAVAQAQQTRPSRRTRVSASINRTRPSRSARCTSSSSTGSSSSSCRLDASLTPAASHERPRVASPRTVDRELRVVDDPPGPLLDRLDLLVDEQRGDLQRDAVGDRAAPGRRARARSSPRRTPTPRCAA